MAKRPAKKATKKKASKKIGSKKVTKKKAKKTAKKTRAKRVKKKTEEEIINQRYLDLIEQVRGSSIEDEINLAFEDILETLRPRIQRMVNKFNIRGLDPHDIMQEALYALRYKAIKDYDKTRGSIPGIAPFDRFALLCIRRHLSTEFKSSIQNNRKKVLNESISLNQESRGNDDDLSLINIIPSGEGTVLDRVQNQEYFHSLMNTLMKSLSKFEKEVLVLYAQKFTYEEIAEHINENRIKIKVNVKGVDNALSRIKNKSKAIMVEFDKKEEDHEKRRS